jgi:hypothetical protein
MSVDSRIFAAGARHRKQDDPRYPVTKVKYKDGDQMPESQMTPHQVYLAHIGQRMATIASTRRL